MALIDLCSTLQKNRDEGYYTCCVFLDLSKAFDTVNHKILLKKLRTYGIQGNIYEMLINYLNDRKQYTECNKNKSQLKTVLYWIPQGSTLGPLLFSQYINNLLLHTSSHVNFFADDTVLLLRDKNIANLKLKLHEELKIVDEWMRANRLSLNYNKSSYFVNHRRRKHGALTNFAINIGEHSIPYSNSAKYLGVIVDQELAWKYHINHTTTKLANAARILSKLRHYVSKKNFSKTPL